MTVLTFNCPSVVVYEGVDVKSYTVLITDDESCIIKQKFDMFLTKYLESVGELRMLIV